MVRITGALEHRLESRTAVICSAQTRLDIFVGDNPALGLAMAAGEVKLQGERNIALGLASGRYARIERRTQRACNSEWKG